MAIKMTFCMDCTFSMACWGDYQNGNNLFNNKQIELHHIITQIKQMVSQHQETLRFKSHWCEG